MLLLMIGMRWQTGWMVELDLLLLLLLLMLCVPICVCVCLALRCCLCALYGSWNVCNKLILFTTLSWAFLSHSVGSEKCMFAENHPFFWSSRLRCCMSTTFLVLVRLNPIRFAWVLFCFWLALIFLLALPMVGCWWCLFALPLHTAAATAAEVNFCKESSLVFPVWRDYTTTNSGKYEHARMRIVTVHVYGSVCVCVRVCVWFLHIALPHITYWYSDIVWYFGVWLRCVIKRIRMPDQKLPSFFTVVFFCAVRFFCCFRISLLLLFLFWLLFVLLCLLVGGIVAQFVCVCMAVSPFFDFGYFGSNWN